jgi:Flp pilus assembly protein TadG
LTFTATPASAATRAAGKRTPRQRSRFRELLQIRDLLQARRGTVAVEFALLAIPFLMLSFGIIECARLIWTDEVLEAAAALGARCTGVQAASCDTTDDAKSYIVSVASGWNVKLTVAEVSVNATTGTCGGVAGFSTVTITYTYQTLVPDLITAFANIPMTVQACFPNQA